MIQGHPDPHGVHYGHALADAYASGARETGHEVTRINVATLEFSPLRSREGQQREPPQSIRQAQSALLRADHVLLFYPVWNGGAPALLKAFLEQTFRPAFIFPDARPGEPLRFSSYFTQRKALSGKTARIVVTMQMPAFVYRWYFRPHPEKNTLRLSGLNPVRESLIGNVEAPDERSRTQWLRKMHALGRDGQ